MTPVLTNQDTSCLFLYILVDRTGPKHPNPYNNKLCYLYWISLIFSEQLQSFLWQM